MPSLSDFWPFFTAFAMLAGAGIGAPIPEEIPTVGAGVWVGSHPEFGPLRWLILPTCWLGVLISDMMLYAIGRRWGRRIMKQRWAQRLISPDTWKKIERNYDRYGVNTLLMVRWIPAIRSPIFISAGVMRLSLVKFIVADTIAVIFGHSLLFFLAYWFGDQFQDLIERAEQKVDRVKPLLILLVLAGVAGFLIYHFLRQPVSTGDPQELPLIGDKVAATIEHATESAPVPTGDPSKATMIMEPAADGEAVDGETKDRVQEST